MIGRGAVTIHVQPDILRFHPFSHACMGDRYLVGLLKNCSPRSSTALEIQSLYVMSHLQAQTFFSLDCTASYGNVNPR